MQKPCRKSCKTKPSKLHLFVLFALAAFVFFMAITVVNMKEKVRVAQNTLYELSTELRQQREKWGELMLQKTHLESPANVENIAKKQLGMQAEPEKYLMVKILPDSKEFAQEREFD